MISACSLRIIGRHSSAQGMPEIMQYKAVKLVKRPTLNITPDLFETVTLETPDLEDGQFLLKQTHMSFDPAMRGWMTATATFRPLNSARSCVPAASRKS